MANDPEKRNSFRDMIADVVKIRDKALEDFVELCVIDNVVAAHGAEYLEMNKLSMIFCTLNTFLAGLEAPKDPILTQRLKSLLRGLDIADGLLREVINTNKADMSKLHDVWLRIGQLRKALGVIVNE